ncbi:MAG: GrdX family protein [Clostridia bacterium]|nr:GrdX family protein [Clostridia bacterium]
MAIKGNQRDYLIVTNNPLVDKTLSGKGYYTIDFTPELTFREILVKVRDLVYEGRTLYTHPLSGSVKPKETPYKSVIVSVEPHGMETDEALIIASAIEVTDKFQDLDWSHCERAMKDFQLIDYCLLCGALGIDAPAGLSDR